MNAKQWRDGDNPRQMVRYVAAHASDRKIRLFLCAHARTAWPDMTFRGRRAVEVAERYCDDPTAYSDMLGAGRAFNPGWSDEAAPWEEQRQREFNPEEAAARSHGEGLARRCTYARAKQGLELLLLYNDTRPEVVPLLHEVFGNPFDPVALEPAWLTHEGGLIPRLARAIYEERAWDRMPILADALEDAGCSDPRILEHCRSDAAHAKGCWVIDLLTGGEPLGVAQEEALDRPEPPPLTLPRPAWVVTLAAGCTATDHPLGDAYARHRLPLLAQEFPEVILDRAWDPGDARRSKRVVSVEEVWYLGAGDGITVPGRAKGRRVEGAWGVAWIYTDREEALRDLAKGYEPVRVLLPLRNCGPVAGRAVAARILNGQVGLLPTLTYILEDAGSPRAAAVRPLCGDAALPALDPPPQGAPPSPDPELDAVRGQWQHRTCPDCQVEYGWNVFRVQKPGPNCGRVFVKCSACGRFDWLDAPPRLASAVASATTTAGTTPQRQRSADPELAAARRQAGPCAGCGAGVAVHRVRKEGPNQGRLFRKCDHCNAFAWL